MGVLAQAVAASPVPLPPGREVPVADGGRETMLWCSDGPPDADLIRQLRAAHPVSGLWPLLVRADPLDDSALELRPHLSSAPDAYDAALVLAGFWHSHTRDGPSGTTDPYGQRWPRVAAAGVPLEDPNDCADALTRELLRDDPQPLRLGLVPAPRGADALSVMGWTGPLNYDNDTARFAAVLRSWEDRFGVSVLHIEGSSLTVSVAADLDAALHLAAEHFAFCPDNLWQGHPPPSASTPRSSSPPDRGHSGGTEPQRPATSRDGDGLGWWSEHRPTGPVGEARSSRSSRSSRSTIASSCAASGTADGGRVRARLDWQGPGGVEFGRLDVEHGGAVALRRHFSAMPASACFRLMRYAGRSSSWAGTASPVRR
jgi:hypothetical protein